MSNAEKLTEVYLKIKDRRSELSAKFKEEDGKLVEQMDKVKKALLEYCKEHGVDSVKTGAGLFYRSAKTRYWTNDWDSMYKFVLEHEALELFDKRHKPKNAAANCVNDDVLFDANVTNISSPGLLNDAAPRIPKTM